MDGSRWILLQADSSCPVRSVEAVPAVDAEKLVAAHEAAGCSSSAPRASADVKAFAAFLAPLRKKRWFVYAKRPSRARRPCSAYLSRYTHRVAISNRRLIAVDERSVTFNVKTTGSKVPAASPR